MKSISSWFEIYEVNGTTFAISEPYHWEKVISYLIIGNNRAALFDTGMGISNIRREIEQLTNAPIVVINSHSHYDHIGGNSHFNEVWVYDDDWEVAHIERGYTNDECREFMQSNDYMKEKLPPEFDVTTYEISPSYVTRRLLHQEIIELGNRQLTVHHTPGESPGSIGLQDLRNKILFTGDIIVPSGTFWVHLEESDFHAYFDSLKYLVGLIDQIDYLCSAHNEAYAPKQLLISALEAFKRISAGLVKPKIIEDKFVYHFNEFNVSLPLDSEIK